MSLEIHFHTFGCPFHSFVFFFFPISEEAKGREAHRHRTAFVRLPSGPWCPGGRYHRETARGDQTGSGEERQYLAPEDAPWHMQLNQPARKKFPGTVNQNNLPRHSGFLKGAPLLF